MHRARHLLPLLLLTVLVGPALTQDVDLQLKIYDYDADQPLNTELAEHEDSDVWIVHHVLFDSANGERVPALLGIPKVGEPPFPLVMVQHGLTGHKDVDYARLPALALAQQGYATLRIDAQYHGERARESDEGKFMEILYDLVGDGGYVQSIVDMRRALDFAETQDEIDTERVGYIGVSMGAMMGSVTCPIDERIDGAVLIIGGAMGPVANEAFAGVDGATFIHLMSPRPVLMLNGKNDPLVQPPWTERLFEAAEEPKEIIWYDTGHTVPPDEATKEISEFMAEHVRGEEGE